MSNTGRIETYVHSDSITPNKGVCVVRVLTQTDFAAKTNELIAFADLCAKYAYGAKSTNWDEICTIFPEMKLELSILEKTLKEKVTIGPIVIVRLED